MIRFKSIPSEGVGLSVDGLSTSVNVGWEGKAANEIGEVASVVWVSVVWDWITKSPFVGVWEIVTVEVVVVVAWDGDGWVVFSDGGFVVGNIELVDGGVGEWTSVHGSFLSSGEDDLFFVWDGVEWVEDVLAGDDSPGVEGEGGGNLTVGVGLETVSFSLEVGWTGSLVWPVVGSVDGISFEVEGEVVSVGVEDGVGVLPLTSNSGSKTKKSSNSESFHLIFYLLL